jgi:Polysaccharide deacetylase
MLTRRRFLASTLAAGAGLLFARRAAAEEDKALVAITLDLEMSRNFPRWEDTYWDYDKGNLDSASKKYTTDACKRVKAAGGVVHCFAVGRVFEQADTSWLKQIAQAGHPVGNHTYDHVNVLAKRLEDVQFRFNRAPWLVEGKKPAEVIRENIRLCGAALKTRVGVDAAGFRTPGGFAGGLADRKDARAMLKELGFAWVSSKYPAHPMTKPKEEPTKAVYDGIVKAQVAAQPFVYPDGLIEVPMSPVSDINAFRAGRWKLDWYLEALRRGVGWAIDNRAVFDLLAHPSCLGVVDPKFRAIDLVCELVKESKGRAVIVGLGAVADRARAARKKA